MIKIKELTEINDIFYEIMQIFYNWWGETKNLTLEEITNNYKSNLNKSLFPKIYTLLKDNKLIGLYELNQKDDILNEPYEPYLANLFIKEEYRHQGYSRLLIKDAITKTSSLGYRYLYLHSKHQNYYEKFGFIFLKETKTQYGIKRIYKYEISKNISKV